MDPKLLQPTMALISGTYLITSLGSRLKLYAEVPALDQFTYYCCILIFISTFIFYSRDYLPDYLQAVSDVSYTVVLIVAIGLYIGHWFVKPKFESSILDPDVTINGKIVAGGQIYEKTVENCFDKRKCSSPMHLVFQSTLMATTTLNILFNFMRY